MRDIPAALGDLIRNFRPNLFTAVMGTGIVALDGFLLPIRNGFFPLLGTLLWVLDAGLLTFFFSLCALRWIFFRRESVGIFLDPAQAQYFGAVSMAITVVGDGFVAIGVRYLGASAIHIAEALWVLTSIFALISGSLIPYLMFAHHELSSEHTLPTWLIPVVDAEVAAVLGALLIPYLPHAYRLDMLVLNYAFWGMSVPVAMIIIVLTYSRFLYHKLPVAAYAPSLWIVLGPLGTGIAALIDLGRAARVVLPSLGPTVLSGTFLLSVVMWGFGCWWLIMATAVTVKFARRLSFSMGWWAFTFPLGVFTSGTYGLWRLTEAPLFRWAGVLLYALLLAFWTVVFLQTARGTFRGNLLSSPAVPSPEADA
ncbi:MAG: C4-dicarboxylate ABC transporter [Thermaerobacter sp.]|jgi:C4-dicarboxylate transporter/malic acid transport protein|nr:C4-dicarboxylate ABC transporter [Thermaerobacter sp.]